MTEQVWVDNGDVRLRVEVTGEGPLLLCVPGWPELPHSWRHQVEHFSQRGYRVAALEVRGYGQSSSPPEPERYTLTELASDVSAVVAALSDEPVVLLGHDWGAPIVWTTAVRYPDQVRGVAGLSVPYTPPAPFSVLDIFDKLYPDRFFYMLTFQEPGVAEAEFAPDVRAALKAVYYALSGDAPVNSLLADAPRDAPFLSVLPTPPAGPLSFLTDAELDVIAATFVKSGMTGSLNRYRALPHDVAASADIQGATVDRPAVFLAGEKDAVRAVLPGADLFATAANGCTDFRGATLIPDVGHWVQQEAPAAVNAALEEFLAGL